MRWSAIALIIGIAACTPAAQDALARDAARQAVRPVLAERFPGVPLEPAIDCIINNATSSELFALAADAVTGPTASTIQIVSDITTRPETLTCLATEGIPVLLGNI
ncbi:MAG: hypothetical protein ACR2OY_01970 [Boseongicola sp.]